MRRLIDLWPDRAYSIEAIARELGTSLGTVSRRAKYLGLTGRRQKSSLSHWFNARRELIRTIIR